MVDVVTHRPPDATDRSVLRELADAATAADGHPPFGDAVWRALEHPSPDSAVMLAVDDGTPVGALHLAPPDNEGEVDVLAALVVAPAHRAAGVAGRLLAVAVGDVAARGGGRVVLWLFGADDAAAGPAIDAGFTVERELLQMRVPLPVDAPRWPSGIDVRSFRPGVDDEAWLAVNNHAFATDPDQSAWTSATLAPRLTEPWFDPDGFLLAWADDRLAGFCWTKLHPPAPPAEADPLGEIYVIGVDPGHQGTGLGRALVLGGLEWLHEHGALTGMLFVDAANRPAIGLYEALGFTIARRDRAYAREIA